MGKNVCIRLFAILFSVCLASFVQQSDAIVLDTVLDRHLVKKAELIFIGTVEKINYRSSESSAGRETPIPHTFVTFAIKQVLKGAAEDKSMITLRFQGGLNEEQQILRVSGSPLLDIGDEGVFFVFRNGISACPIVGGRHGFIRVAGDRVFSDLGNDLILSKNPIAAARLHPYDFDYSLLIQQLLQPDNEAKRAVSNNLSKESIALLRSPDSWRDLDSQAFSFELPLRLAGLIRFDQPVSAFHKQFFPVEFRHAARNLVQLLLYRDLNAMLLQPTLFTQAPVFETLSKLLNEELLRRLTTLARTQSPLSSDVVLTNRRVLESIYPNAITRSLDQIIVNGQYQPREEIMVNLIGNYKFAIEMVPPEEGEGRPPQPDMLPEGEVMTPQLLLPYLEAMVVRLHTAEELQTLKPVLSANPDIAFTLPPLRTARPPQNFTVPQKPPRTDQEQLELKLLEESGGNPVFSNSR